VASPMSTYLAFHAHPDDEAIATGGTMLMASKAGHKVVLVIATRGECGEVAEGVLEAGESLGSRREDETRRAAEILGVHRVEFLGYHDSGMIGEPSNDNPDCFWQADVEQAAARLARILTEENVDVITVYDSHGGYGHPDHIQVHRVGHRAAELAGVSRVYESTFDRDHIAALRSAAEAAGLGEEIPDDADTPDDAFGSPAADITTRVDVGSVVAQKRASMAAHASQITEESFFLAMPDEMFAMAFGLEWFIRTDSGAGGHETSIFDEMPSSER